MNTPWRCGCALAVFLAMASLAAAAGEESVKLQDAPGRDLVVARCSVCHSVDYVQMNAPVLDRTGWEKSVRKMIDQFGAPISEADAKSILDYLAANY
jgi:sulfite dehydrogenase (cytochrome) subunit B